MSKKSNEMAQPPQWRVKKPKDLPRSTYPWWKLARFRWNKSAASEPCTLHGFC
ncbi:hypothetical protein [Acidovorax sp. CCYZU-2555]|uniref:hypothetical protein n=1 Tax=Acidovorax sp. CCYZU-2555 TaxID=2835042 RepID=UPI001BCAFC37|nr:hypothetical protein [Acidovorax sp. CCYZU-2555]MBS7780533.1 hypothetical protein [Acidovorax sp. CCYZU-2555]